MERRQVVWLATGVFVVSVCAALPFRRPPEKPSEAVENGSASDLVLHAPANGMAAAITPPTAEISTTPSGQSPEADAATPTKIAAAQPQPVSEGEADLPVAPAASAVQDTGASAASPVAESSAAENSLDATRPHTWRRHRIKDGDTLAKLAQQYLGDPAREAEIYALNRDILSSPDLLPIGVWLRIPVAEAN